VSMSDARSSLYRRIECLLVPGFLLASKSRRWVAALVGIPMLVVAFLLGMARLDTWAVAEVPEERSSISTEQEGAPEPGEDDQLKYKSYSGSVTDSDGSPVSGAKIWLSRSFYKQNTDPKEFIRLEVAQTDSQGRFDFEIDQAVLRKFHSPAYGYSPSSNQLLAHLALIAEAPDRRVSGLPIMVFADGIKPSEMVGLQKQVDGTLGGGHFERRTIELPPSIGPVKAKLLDLDGEPITNVAVRLESIESTKIADLLAELEKRDTDATNLIRHERQFMFSSKLAAYLIARSQPAIVTNAQGEFELSGLGKDQLAALTLSSSKHEASRIMVLGRDMESKRIPNVSIYPNGAQDVFFGSQFTHVLGPSVPIAGTVTEYQSGKPIAGATVYVERLFREKGMSDNNRLRLSTEYIRTVSDENGRYTLRGLPPGGEHVIEVVPPASEPWLTSSNVVSPSVNEKMHLLDIQVYRGIWIEGSLTDGPSGEPLRGTVDYLALRSNTNTPRSVGLRQGWNHFAFPVDDSGHYRVVGLPGPGLVLARSVVGERKYPLAVGADEVEGYDPESRSLPTYRSLPVTNWNRIQQIDPPKGAESFSCDLTLTAGTSLAGRVVAPRKLEKLELEMLGLNDTQFWAQLKDDTFTVHNYEPDEPRRLFVRTKDHSLAGTLLVEGKSPDNLLVQLEPAVTVTGRLIDTSKDEPAAGYMIFCEKSTLGYFRIGTNNRSPTTDEDGRFTITGLLAGIEYSAMSANVQRFSSGKNNFQIDLSDAKPGANIELGDVTGPNSK
ncbi:MAG TPA: hypothetical protein DDW52_25805, partial [Planctomycetaceae bacterium]|nr:hypothetical protein [Planctomycetaceae bacterium]